MRLTVQVALVAAAAGAALVVPEARPALLVGSNWVAAALMAVGVLRHRPSRLLPWVMTTTFVALIAVSSTATLLAGTQTTVTAVATTAGQLCAAAALPSLLRDGSRRSRSAGRVLDMTILVVVTGLFALELLLLGLAPGPGGGSWLVRYTPVLDLALIGVLLWLLLSRARLVPALVLILVGAFGSLAYDLLCTVNGQRAAALDASVAPMGVVNMMMFALAALHPSMTLLGTPDGAPRSRRPSAQLLMVLPVAVLPVGLLAVDRDRPVDPPVEVAVVLLVVVLAFARAVVALRETEAAAERDPLTGLLNRAGLHRAHGRMQSAAHRAGLARRSLLLVDLDGFKEVNDRYGHGTGDRLLLVVAGRLARVVGDEGVVARHGGDEFILLVDPGEATADPGRAVVDAVTVPAVVDGRRVALSVSVGVVDLEPGASLETQLADADIALDRAKQQRGSAVVRFDRGMRDAMVAQVSLAEELRALLSPATPAEVRAEQLTVRYQPIVDLGSGAVTGAEALVRWQHPERGLLAPDAFLPLVEREGLGPRLDEHVLAQACDRLRRWNEGRATPLTMSVNLGLGSMCDPGLVGWVAAAIEDAGVPAGWVCLEITEHDQLPQDDAVADRLRAVVDLGCRLSLDDFGVGYTSLSYLQRFPVSLVKLDRSLLTGEHAGPELLRGIAALGRSLHLDLLAEGVELDAHHDQVRDLGIRYGQGYHYARPLPAAEFAAAAGGVQPARPTTATLHAPRRSAEPPTPTLVTPSRSSSSSVPSAPQGTAG